MNGTQRSSQREFLGVGWKFPLQVTPGGTIAQAKYEQHKDRHDQGEQHGPAAGEIAHFFFEDRGHGLGESREIPSQFQALGVHDDRTRTGLAMRSCLRTISIT